MAITKAPSRRQQALHTVVRIVVEGFTWRRRDKENFAQAKKMLDRAFHLWPENVTAKYTITPGGFIRTPLPQDYHGRRGWKSRPEDFQKLIPTAQAAVDEVLSMLAEKTRQRLRDCTQFLTLGVDLIAPGQHKLYGGPLNTHAELVAIIKASSGQVVQWTGKSYPVANQERTLVQETDLNSHLFSSKRDRVLILGCHDLNMFSNRSWANQSPDGQRRQRCIKMRKLAKKFEPNIVLQHPHVTDTYRTWQTPWSGVQQKLPSVNTWASGIAWGDEKEPQALEAIQARTHRGDVCDIVVKGC